MAGTINNQTKGKTVTGKRTDANNEQLFAGHERQPLAFSADTAKKQGETEPAGPKQEPERTAPQARQPADPPSFRAENLKIKKEMAVAMLKMGLSKKDVMGILNVVIK